MRKLVVVLVVLGVLLVGADFAAKAWAESKLESRARQEARGAASVDAQISSFPFLGRLLVDGSVRRVNVHLEEVASQAVTLSDVDIDLRGVRLDRDGLFSGSVKLTGIDHGTIAVALDDEALGRVLKVPLSVGGGEVSIQVAGRKVPVRPAVGGNGSLVLRAQGVPGFTVPIARSRLVTCAAVTATVEGDQVRLSCEVDEVPPSLRG